MLSCHLTRNASRIRQKVGNGVSWHEVPSAYSTVCGKQREGAIIRGRHSAVGQNTTVNVMVVDSIPISTSRFNKTKRDIEFRHLSWAKLLDIRLPCLSMLEIKYEDGLK